MGRIKQQSIDFDYILNIQVNELKFTYEEASMIEDVIDYALQNGENVPGLSILYNKIKEFKKKFNGHNQ